MLMKQNLNASVTFEFKKKSSSTTVWCFKNNKSSTQSKIASISFFIGITI